MQSTFAFFPAIFRTAENFTFILHKNVNSKLDLFPDKLHPNKKDQGILKGNFRKFINEYV